MNIEAINIGQGVVLLDTGKTLPVDTYLDSEGDECRQEDDVAALIVQLPDSSWASVIVSDFDPATVQ